MSITGVSPVGITADDRQDAVCKTRDSPLGEPTPVDHGRDAALLLGETSTF